jgi:hypothetical protein
MLDSKTTIPFDWQPPSATMTEEELREFRLPVQPLKMLPQYGVFLWWPAEPNLWAHPNDFETIREFVPGHRIFRRDVSADYSDRELGFVVYEYGNVRFRAKPILWREIRPEVFRPGDFVEVKSRSGKTRPRIGRISEILWDRHSRRTEYVITCRNIPLARKFHSEELRPAIPLGEHLPQHHLNAARKESVL